MEIAGGGCWRCSRRRKRGRLGFVDGGGHGFRAILANEFEQFADLARQGAIGVGQAPQIDFRGRTQQGEQALLCADRWAAGGSNSSVSNVRLQGLAAPPGARIADDLVLLVVDGDRGGSALTVS